MPTPRSLPTAEIISDKERLRAAYGVFNTADGQIVLAHLQFLVDHSPLPLVMQKHMEAIIWKIAQQQLVRDIESYVSGVFDPTDMPDEYETGGEFDAR